MQILHLFQGSIQQYEEEISDCNRYRPKRCPQCQGGWRLRAHGFYCRTIVDVEWEGTIRVRRYWCRLCQRTVSLLPEFVLPYLRCSISVIGLFLVARLLEGRSLAAAAWTAGQGRMPYQRGQFWVRRFQQQAPALCAALVTLTGVSSAADFVTQALGRLQALGWITAHRFLFAELRTHLLGWPRFLFPHGSRVTAPAAGQNPGRPTHSICLGSKP